METEIKKQVKAGRESGENEIGAFTGAKRSTLTGDRGR